MSILADFIELQNLDYEISLLNDDQKRLPGQLLSCKRSIENAEKLLLQYKEESKRKQIDLRETEISLAEVESSMAKKEQYLNQVKSNKEYSTLRNEIAEKKKQKVQFEESILVLMEENEKKKQQYKVQEKEIEKLRNEYKELEKEAQVDLEKIEKELQDLLKTRQEKKSVLEKKDPKTFERYDRVIQSNTGKAMVPVEEEACSFCHIQLSPNELALLLSGKIVFCNICQRLLYIPSHVQSI